jgi:hypothetical protein
MTDFDSWVQRTPPDPLTPKEEALANLEWMVNEMRAEQRNLPADHPLQKHWQTLERLALQTRDRIISGAYDDELKQKGNRLAALRTAHREPGTAERVTNEGALTL